ncbi:MAG: MFS transporter [Chloroflexi bacterium]|nr:MFS transporter [Chloroflexota bacterium]
MEETTAGPVATPPLSGVARLALLDSLRNRGFRFLLGSNVGAQLGVWSMNLATGFLVYDVTGSKLQLGIIASVNGVGTFFSSPVGGALADRFDRRKVVALSQSVMMTSALTMGLLVASGHIHLWHIYLLTFITNSMFACFTPSRQAMVSDLIPGAGLTNAIGVNAVVMNAMQALAPAVGGRLLVHAGVQGVYYLMAGAYVLSICMILSVYKIPAHPDSKRPKFIESVRAGAAYARSQREIATVLLVIAIFATLGNSYQNLMAAYTKDVLHLGGGWLGNLQALAGVGAMLGALVIAVTGDSIPKGKAMLLWTVADGICLICLGVFAHLGSAIPILIFIGLSGASVISLGNVLLQHITSPEYRGRVMALYFLMFAFQPLGTLPAGAIADRIGLRETFAISGGLIIAITAVIAIRAPHLRRAR